MMSWTWDGTVLEMIDEPDADSVYPERQPRKTVKHHPLGLDTTDSTIITDMGAPSVEAKMMFRCSATMQARLIALERTTFTVVDPWGISRDWYLERLGINHMVQSDAGNPFYEIAAFMVER